MGGAEGIATGLWRGGDDLPCLGSTLVDMLTLGPVTAGFVFFLCFSFVASLKPRSLATSRLPAMRFYPKRAVI